MLLAVLMISAKALAYDFEVDGICYNILSETTCKVAYKNFSEGHYEGSVTIPEQVTYNGITRVVTAIGDFAFNGCENLTNIDIPNSVTSIGSYAFQRCINLKSIDIPNSVTSIDDSAFEGCFSLTSVDIPNSITSIREYTFDFCKSLMSVDIPNSVTSIGECAFMNCYSLTRVAIPNSVTSIGDHAFQSCKALKSVNIPNSVTKIFPNTFYNCPWLRRLVFVDGGEELEVNSQVFEDCSFIEQLYLGRNLTCPESSDPSLNLTTLADVTIGSLVADVTAIDWTKNESLLSIKSFAATPPVSGKFTNPQYMNLKVSVPSGSLSSYKEDIVWRNFWNLQDDLPSAASIGEIPATQSIKAADGRIIVENAQGRIEIYTLSGILMESLPAQGGTTEIHLPQGVYIVKAGGETVKVIL